MIGVTYVMRPLPPAQRIELEGQRTAQPGWLPRVLTRDALILIITGGIFAIGGGIFMSRRMTAPLSSAQVVDRPPWRSTASPQRRPGSGERTHEPPTRRVSEAGVAACRTVVMEILVKRMAHREGRRNQK